VSTSKQPTGAALRGEVLETGQRLVRAQPLAFAVGNMVRRVLHFIREEEAEEVGARGEGERADSLGGTPEKEVAPEGPGTPEGGSFGLPPHMRRHMLHREISLHRLFELNKLDLSGAAGAEEDSEESEEWGENRSTGGGEGGGGRGGGGRAAGRRKAAGPWQGKHGIIEAINELIDELDDVMHTFEDQAVEHVHSREIILTVGSSDATKAFMLGAAKKRNFEAVVAEGAPGLRGHDFARELAGRGVQSTLIADSAIFAMMARVNKVVVGAHAMLADGGVMAPIGTHLVALVAKRHNVPFVVVVGLHKLTPFYPHDPQVVANDFRTPQEVIDPDVLAEAYQGDGTGRTDLELRVPSPTYDYVPPRLISLLVTDQQGGLNPSYVYRLLSEFYSPEDYNLGFE